MDAGIALFRAWTGRETTCVDTVEVVNEVNGRATGVYRPLTRDIAVEVPEPALTTVYELCHALDDEEGGETGGASREGAEVLAP